MTLPAIFATMARMAAFRSDPRRYLCSQLVTLLWSGQSRVVNLEEIWRDGAVLECDESVPSGIHAEMRTETGTFAGIVSNVEEHDSGWRVELEFSPLTPWSPDRFRPEHLLDPSELKG